MLPKETFINQEISYNNGNGEMKISTVSAYIKYFIIIIQVEREMCQMCYIWKISIELVSYKRVMSIEWLNSSNSQRKTIIKNIQHWQQTTLRWMTHFRIISRNHCFNILYVKMVPILVMKQETQHSQCE